MRFSFLPCAALLACFAVLAPLPGHASSDDVVMLGPIFHYNFNWGHEGAFSVGLEGSYWPGRVFPWGMDAGIEYDLSGRTRLYVEAEASGVFYGGALGPCLEIGGGRILPGLQASAWANLLLGADFRWRALWGSDPEPAPGLYFKIPVVHPDWKNTL